METLEFVPATAEHADALAPHMRDADVAEVLAFGGLPPLETLTECLHVSDQAFAFVLGGEVLALFGTKPWPGTHPHTAAHAWLLTSKAVERHRREFLRASVEAVQLLLGRSVSSTEGYHLLVSLVDNRYTRALRWAAWLGFEVYPPQPNGVAQLPFNPIILRRRTWVP